MSKHIIETVTFRLNDGVKHDDFVTAARAMNRWVAAQPGFMHRRLSCTEDGTWIEHVQWQDMRAARAAAATIGTTAGNAPFLAAIDGGSVRLSHSELEVAIDQAPAISPAARAAG